MTKYFLIILWTCIFSAMQAQTLPTDTALSIYRDQTSIQALRSITLKNGFTIPAGKTVTISIAAFPMLLSQPTVGQNYIQTKIFKEAGITLAKINTNRSIGQENQIIEYFDGLSRPKQTVQVMASPKYKDIVQHVDYDGFGRQDKQYLPYAHSQGNGSFKAGGGQSVINFYSKTTGADISDLVRTKQPFAVTVFENSPLNRIQEQGAQGQAWQPAADRTLVKQLDTMGHTVLMSYGTNVDDDIALWKINDDNISANGSGFYTKGKLQKTLIRDENWTADNPISGTVEEYRDYEDRVILKRIWQSENKKLETHYVYDNYGNLRYVVPPSYTDDIISETNSELFNELIYAYKYDGRHRLIEKKIPGKGWQWLVYNINDQLILTQDAVQRSKKDKEWTYIKYDAYGRRVESGKYIANYADQNTAQLAADKIKFYWEERTEQSKRQDNIVFTKYTNKAFPNVKTLTPLVISYYDDYYFDRGDTILLKATSIVKSLNTKSLQTGSLVYNDDGTSPLLTINYYDDYARIIQTASMNHMGGKDYITNTYNFVGDLLTSTRVHTPVTGSPTTITSSNIYDHVGRLVDTKKKVNLQSEILQSRMAYNEIGQLKSKNIHSENGGQSFLTNLVFAYNERGWLSKMTSPKFSYQLNYNVNSTGKDVLPNAQYNGNVAQQLWGHSASTNSIYSYGYDALNRMTSGVSTGTNMSEIISYDEMGNITKLIRDNGNAISYSYFNDNKSNRLASVDGALKGNYTYDLNGNALTDRSGITYSYNYLNLPNTVVKTGTNVKFIYDANGTKLRKTSKVGTIDAQQDYVAGIEYSNLGNGGIERIATEEGYLLNSNGTYIYHYNLKDHLGNVRSVLKREGSATVPMVVQKQDYYPFGKTKGILTDGKNKYLYNGKEVQAELGNQLDYGARFYDAEIGRWNVVDPLADVAHDWSPYRYGYNNPIKFTDPSGMLEDDYTVDDMGMIELVRKTDDNFDRLIKVDDRGKETSTSVTVDKGILKETATSVFDGTSKQFDDYTIMQTLDNTQGLKLFEFLSNNTKVEWGRIAMTGGSIISTSHEARRDRSSGTILLSLLSNGLFMNSKNFLMKSGIIQEQVHSHPNSERLGASGNYGSGGSTNGDKKFAELVEALNPNLPLKIYHIKTGGVYFRYNSRENLIR